MGEAGPRSRGALRVRLESELDPEGDEKALKNSDQGQGMAGSAFLKGHSLAGWRGSQGGAGDRG